MAQVRIVDSPIRARRRRRRVFFSYVALALFWGFVGALIWLSHAPFMRIERVSVKGAQTVAQEAIETRVREVLAGAHFNIFPKDNILLYPREELVAALRSAYPTLDEITIQAQDFTSIVVEARDREPRALWCGMDVDFPEECLLLDEEGTAYAQAPQLSADPYIKYYGKLAGGVLPRQYLSPETFRSLAALVDALAQRRSGIAVNSVRVEEGGDTHALFSDGFALIFSARDDGGDVFERFTLALEAEPFKGHALSDFEYLDLRFGDRLYYKLKSE